MYQLIDDPEEEERGTQPRASIFPFVIGALMAGAVFFAVWLASPGQPTTPGQTVETPASRAAYLTALKEPNPAFRRARLLDYQREFPDTDRADAIQDQLDVINASEQQDWDALTRSIYSARAEIEDKRASLIAYETRWNGRLLGGRGEELETLRGILDDATASAALPDRSLEPGKSPIPDSVPSDILAGAPPQMAVTFPIYEPPVELPTTETAKAVIVPARIRRNVKPSYPRSAQRKKIGAIVTLSMNINEKGRVAMTEIISVEADRYEKEFTRAAERAAMRTRFHPKTIDGKAVPAVGVRKRYIFRTN